MVVENIKPLVKGTATLECIESGGNAIYKLIAGDGHIYQFNIDLSDKHDCGESAKFLPFYEKAITLMRWIRRCNENDSLILIQ